MIYGAPKPEDEVDNVKYQSSTEVLPLLLSSPSPRKFRQRQRQQQQHQHQHQHQHQRPEYAFELRSAPRHGGP